MEITVANGVPPELVARFKGRLHYFEHVRTFSYSIQELDYDDVDVIILKLLAYQFGGHYFGTFEFLDVVDVLFKDDLTRWDPGPLSIKFDCASQRWMVELDGLLSFHAKTAAITRLELEACYPCEESYEEQKREEESDTEAPG